MQHFDSSVDDVRQHLLTMAGHAETSLTSALKSLWERDDNKAMMVINNDNLLDQLQKEVDQVTFRHLALRHPFAGNLRYVASAMRIACNLERIGDESVTIARRTLALNAEPPLAFSRQIHQLATLASSMLHMALNAYVGESIIQAEEVINSDIEMDNLNLEKNLFMVDRMMQDAKTITRCIHFIVISKSLERIADHATNIAECTLFLHTGKHVRRGERTSLITSENDNAGI